MDSRFSLYIDHQSIAPLVRQLQRLVQSGREELEGEGDGAAMRMALYQQFLRRLHALYIDRHPEIKEEDGAAKLEGLAEGCPQAMDCPPFEGLIEGLAAQTAPKRLRGTAGRNLQVEVQLMRWVQSSDKRIFEKREIDEKYQELVDDAKKTLTLKKIKELVERFKMPSLIVRTRNKQEHFFGVDPDASVSTIVKKEEGSLNHSFWEGEDDKTIKDSRDRSPEPIKEEFQSFYSSRNQQQPSLPSHPDPIAESSSFDPSSLSVKLDV